MVSLEEKSGDQLSRLHPHGSMNVCTDQGTLMALGKPSILLQAKATMDLLLTFTIKDLNNSLISQPRDCNKANGAKE